MTWIDQELSGQLRTLCQSGENQKLDYKQQFPAQARDLAKDIAAFASSGGGLILLGVRDDGSVVGIPNADQAVERDGLSQRIAGICKAIEPPVRPRLRWAMVHNVVVLGVDVPAGREPIYYVDHRPYLRHETTCRPAKPSEVYDAVKAHTREQGGTGAESATNAILTRLAGVLVKLLRWANVDSNSRSLKPWVDEWEWDAREAADSLRDVAIEESVAGTEMETELRELALALDDVVNFTHALGNGPDFDGVSERVGQLAQEMMDKRVSHVPFSADAEATVRQIIVRCARKLKDLWSRAEAAPFSNLVPEAQRESGGMGRQLVDFSYYGVAVLDGPLREELRRVGFRLFELETRTTYYDGGDSQRRAIVEGLACAAILAQIVAAIE
jgi:hypothetical protein